jgi:hypothetical protein
MNSPKRTNDDVEPDRWREKADCRSHISLEWIEPNARGVELCRKVCAGCVVRAVCLHTALVSGEPWGIWGGLTPDERAEIAASGAYPMPAVSPPHGTNPRYAKHGCRCRLCREAHTIYERHRRQQLPVSTSDDSGRASLEPNT